MRLLETLYKDTMSVVRVDGGLSEWFETVVGVMQGCVLSPLLFNIMLEVVIALALEDNEIGVNISGINISNFRFADDICLAAGSNKDLQQLVDKVYTTSNRFELKVNSTKTEMQCIGKRRQQMKIKLGSSDLTQCEQFVYLGRVISEDISCDLDVAQRIGLAASIVRNIHNIWKGNDISKSTKVLLYQTLVRAIVLYNSETWTLKEEHKRKLRVFEMSVLRKICGITRRDRKRNSEVLKELDIEKDIVQVLQTRRLTYFGHVNRIMHAERYPYVLLHGHTHGHRPKGKPKKKWIDNIRKDCINMDISLYEASCLTSDRTVWRNTV